MDPVAFLIVRGDSVKLLPVMPPPATTLDRVIETVPEVVDKVTDFIDKQQAKSAAKAETIWPTDSRFFQRRCKKRRKPVILTPEIRKEEMGLRRGTGVLLAAALCFALLPERMQRR